MTNRHRIHSVSASQSGPGSAKHAFKKRPSMEPTEEQVLAAVSSLYVEQIKPFGRIILRRLGEHAIAGGGGEQEPPYIDGQRLHMVCESCHRLVVQAEPAREYSVALVDQLGVFVDPSDPNDPYPQDMWDELEAYFAESGDGYATPGLPAGRYACARALASLGLSKLRERSMGELCHVVALAIGKRKILGYGKSKETGAPATVPFYRSDLGIKERHAEQHERILGSGSSSDEAIPVASWEDVRFLLWRLLGGAGQQASVSIPLPNVKRLFLSDFSYELSETALGHARLQDLLQDDRLRDVCRLRKRKGVYIVERPALAPAAALAVPTLLPLLSTTPQTPPVAPVVVAPASQRTREFAPLPLDGSGSMCSITCVATDLLMEKIQESPWVDTKSSSPSVSSSALNAGFSPGTFREKFLESPWLIQSSPGADNAATDCSAASVSRCGRFSSLMLAEEGEDVVENLTDDMYIQSQTKNTFVHFAPFLRTAAARCQSVPPNMKLAQQVTS